MSKSRIQLRALELETPGVINDVLLRTQLRLETLERGNPAATPRVYVVGDGDAPAFQNGWVAFGSS